MKIDRTWRALFERANPAPPPGFEQRHDRLLRRLTAVEEAPRRRRVPMRALIALALSLVALGALAAGRLLGLGDFFRRALPGEGARTERLQAFGQGFEPLSVEQDGMRLTLHELILDGRWAYASVRVEPAAQGLLPVPFGEADEPLRPGGAQSYREHARRNDLRMAQVSVYLEGGALSGDYFIDDAWDDEGRLMIYLGGEAPGGGEGYSLRVITQPEGGDRSDRAYPLRAQVRDGALTRVYPAMRPAGDSGVTLKEARLTLTALCAYLDVSLEGGEMHADLMKGEDYWPRGLSMSVNGYEMDELPDSIDLRLEDPRSGRTWDITGLKGE